MGQELEIIAKKDIFKTRRFTVKVKNKYCFIPTENIKYISSMSYYVEVFTINEEKFIQRTSVKDLIQKLDSNLFLRINRSTIINVYQIKELVSEGQGDFSVSMLDGKYFSLSKIYKKELFHYFGI